MNCECTYAERFTTSIQNYKVLCKFQTKTIFVNYKVVLPKKFAILTKPNHIHTRKVFVQSPMRLIDGILFIFSLRIFLLNKDVTIADEGKGSQLKAFARIIFIPHATSCGGYNVFDPSVSQSVSQ